MSFTELRDAMDRDVAEFERGKALYEQRIRNYAKQLAEVIHNDPDLSPQAAEEKS